VPAVGTGLVLTQEKLRSVNISYRLLELHDYIADSANVLRLARDVKCEEPVLS